MTTSLASLHHFCKECETPALAARQTIADMGEKCGQYCSKLADRLSMLKIGEVDKAEKATVDSVGARVIEM